MKTDNTKIIRTIDVGTIYNYLVAKGWKRIAKFGKPIAVFRNNDDTEEIILAVESKYRDYERLIGRAIDTLVRTTSKDEYAVINELLMPNSDILKFRLDGRSVENGTLPIRDAISFFESTKRALLASALTTLEPRKHYPRMSNKRAEDYIKLCRMGQTEVGSYVSNVICPIAGNTEEDNQPELFVELPAEKYGRKVTKTFLKIVHALSNSIASSTVENILNVQDESAFVSSNMCEAIYGMRPAEPADLSIELVPAPLGPPMGDTPTQVKVLENYFPSIYELSVNLREKEKPRRGMYVGQIYSLKRDPEGEELLEGVIVFEFKSDDKIMNAHVTLNKKDYEAACDVHKANGYVSIEGELIRKGRYHYIDRYTVFKRIKSGLD